MNHIKYPSDFNLKFEHQRKHEHLIEIVKNMYPDICNWIGIYYCEEPVDEEDPKKTTLHLGPYIGVDTSHTKISTDQGICGMAIRELSSINIADVDLHPEYLACSTETKSELVIPIYNDFGLIVGELDIDSHHSDAFSEIIQEDIENLCDEFSGYF